MTAHFSTAYLPPISYFKALVRFDGIELEAYESWQKQSYRNRTYIYGPHGAMMLNIPIKNNENKSLMGTVEISYETAWQNTHWQAIKTAYGSAPFFEVLGPDLEAFYKKPLNRLMDWNTELLNLILDWLQISPKVALSESWQPEVKNDFREAFHPKRKDQTEFKTYPQVFSDEYGFIENLSVLDLLFNEGPAAFDYLKH